MPTLRAARVVSVLRSDWRHARGLALACAVVSAGAISSFAHAQATGERPSSKNAMCATCHSDLGSRKVTHTPVAEQRCLDCHQYANPAKHLFELKMPRNDLCGSCHAQPHDRVVHAPVAEKNCIGCHDVHGSAHPAMLVEDPGRDLCLTCHNEGYADKKFVHGPVAVGACIICHDAHASAKPALLRRSSPGLCLDCHSELKPPKGLAASLVHSPVREDCTSCHDPHASDHAFQLKDKTPELCFSCHTTFSDWLQTAGVHHGPVDEAGGCIKCHSPHFSRIPRLQKQAQPELCLSCHDKQIDLPGGRTITNMKTLLAENPSHHGPIREGACTACHQPHASEHFRLLVQDYPADFYAPFDMDKYKLCFTCHQSDLVKDQSGTGLTGFRNGDLNLHWVHVNREKGRTCRACHEVHASKREFHLRDSVPFGSSGWSLPINYRKTPDGGACLPGCHKSREYSRLPGSP